MKTLRILVVDDEKPARDRLGRLLRQVPGVEVAGEAANGLQALEEAARLKPDAILLDIEMPELDGLGVAASLPRGGSAIVFCTAYDEHALKAFELAAVDYLVKPVAEERLAAAMDRIRDRRSGDDAARAVLQHLRGGAAKRMAVRCGAKFVVFDPARVSAVLARDHYSAILADGRELLSDDGLDALLERFDEEQFIRVHRSGIINLAFLKELQHGGDRRYIAVLSDPDQTRVPVSRERLPVLKAKLGLDS